MNKDNPGISFQSIIDSYPYPLAAIDRQNRFILFNSSAVSMIESLYGIQIQKGISLLDCIGVQSVRDMIKSNIEKAVATGRGLSDFYIDERSESRRHLNILFNPIVSQNGEIDGILLLAMDVTGPKQYEEELIRQSSEINQLAQFLTAVLTSAPDHVYAWNRDKQIMYANDSLERYWGLTLEQYLGKTNVEIGFTPDLCRLIEDGIDRVVTTGEPVRGEAPYADSAGEQNYYDHIFSPIKRSDGSVEAVVGISRNITDRKKMEEKLQISLQQLSFHHENTPLAVVEFNQEYQIIRWSDNAAKMFGWSADEVMGKKISDFKLVFEEDSERIGLLSSEMLSGKRTSNVQENRNYRKDGSVITCIWYNSALINSKGELVSVNSLVQDVTRERKAEAVIKESEERFRKYFELGLVGMAIESPAGGWIAVNDRLCEIYGYSRDELMQVSWKELTLPDDLEKDLTYLAEFQAGLRDYYSTEKRYVRKDGKVITCVISTTCMRNAGGDIESMYLIVEDITRQKEYAEQIARVNEELEERVRDRTAEIALINTRLRSLYQRLIQVQEEERRRLSLELHDEIGQIMTGLNLSLEIALRSSGKASKGRIQHGQAILRELMTRTRNLSMGLSPTTLNNLRLIPAMSQYIDHFTSQTGIKISFRHDASLPILSIDIKTAVYRIVQESLTNIARHAGVKSADVSIGLRKNSPGVIDIKIADRGKGFDLASVLLKRMPMGLTGMHERAEYLGGTFKIDTAVGKGTIIEVSLPIATEK